MPHPIYRIFISSTFNDLAPERKAVEQAVADLNSAVACAGVSLFAIDLRRGSASEPPLNDSPEFNGQPSPGELQTSRQIYSDYMREDRMDRQEQDLLMDKYAYVENIKRLLGQEKWTEQNLRETAEKLTNHKDRLDELLRLAREPNPRPWP